MSERYKPKDLYREARDRKDLPRFKPEPRDQLVWRDGKPTILQPLCCRLHGQPWQTCTLCSKFKR